MQTHLSIRTPIVIGMEVFTPKHQWGVIEAVWGERCRVRIDENTPGRWYASRDVQPVWNDNDREVQP